MTASSLLWICKLVVHLYQCNNIVSGAIAQGLELCAIGADRWEADANRFVLMFESRTVQRSAQAWRQAPSVAA